MRSLNLRRLSYVLFSGDKNHFLAQLPSIQEKLVEILRNITSPIIQSEVNRSEYSSPPELTVYLGVSLSAGALMQALSTQSVKLLARDIDRTSELLLHILIRVLSHFTIRFVFSSKW